MSEKIEQERFQNLLKQVNKNYTIKAIAINCLMPIKRIESWLRGEELPKRSIIFVLNKVLQNMNTRKTMK
jgi:hypothetical protein